ncbi:IS481 family transposase, partial [Patescibacteria group bacterium]|nr:IS481 family transposase [Patescibacteria group bacterium]
MTSLYHSLKESQGSEAARSLARTVLANNCDNVSRTSEILGCSRLCVRRARDGTLEDMDRTPINQPKRTEESLENFILTVRNETNYGKVRLRKHIKIKYGLELKVDLVGKILKRNKVRRQVYRRPDKESKPLYPYETLLPFEQGQVDTKHIDDFGALGKMVFRLRRYNLPLYQWTYICAKTKTKFHAYSYTLDSQFGVLFMAFIVLWLRVCGVKTRINYQGDNGTEFCSGSKRKEERLNDLLKPLNASFKSIPAGKKYLQGIVERSHRTDDEELYRPYLDRISSPTSFMQKAQGWQDTYNSLRPSWGKGMNGKTPLEKLKESGILQPEQILRFPVIILDDLFSVLKSGNYLCNHY